MDITATFSQSLTSHKSTSKLTTHSFDLATLNSFLQEAYRINTHITDLTRYLRSIRAPYLALGPHRPATLPQRNGRSTQRAPTASAKLDTQHMTDSDRKQIEQDTKTLLTTLSSAIGKLAQAANAEVEARAAISQHARSKRGFGALGRWAAGIDTVKPVLTPEEKVEEERVESVKLHREGVLWFLQRRLEAVGEVQRDMVAVRLQRAVEKNKSVLYRAGMDVGAVKRSGMMDGMKIERSVGLNAQATGADAAKAVEIEQESKQQSLDSLLSPEQIQMFEKEQDSMVKFYNSELQKIKAVESSLYEISSLQTELSMNLELQSEHVSQLVSDSVFTTQNLSEGNKQLKRATERPSTARMVFYATCGLCTTLIVWDLIF